MVLILAVQRIGDQRRSDAASTCIALLGANVPVSADGIAWLTHRPVDQPNVVSGQLRGESSSAAVAGWASPVAPVTWIPLFILVARKDPSLVPQLRAASGVAGITTTIHAAAT